MKKREIIELYTLLNKIKEFGTTKFKYTILRNLDVLKKHIDILQQIENDIKSNLSEFESGRNQIIMELGTQKEDGTTSIDQNDSEVMKKFNQRVAELFNEHKDSIDTYNTRIAEYQEILNEELEEEIVFRYFSVDNLPEEDLSSEQLNLLIKFNIIKD